MKAPCSQAMEMLMSNMGGAILIGGLRGSSGKTAVSVGLAAAWRQRGYPVIPFKKGPDYVDAAWLTRAAGAPCYSLDTYLLGKQATEHSFMQRSRSSAVSLIEGNRGLYDGMDEQGSHSTAELAKLLGVPLVVVIDCTKATRTVAAMVMGLMSFDPQVSIQGVILNRVGGKRHEKILRDCIEAECGIPVWGAIPRQERFSFPERHLGLVPPDEHPFADPIIQRTAKLISSCLDIEGLYSLACKWSQPEHILSASETYAAAKQPVRIGVFRDSAFQFYYPENLEALTRQGASLVYISPLSDAELPAVDAVYIGGGFPETHGRALAENESFIQSLRARVDGGLPVYAECGGLMYLGRSLEFDGRTYPMAGVLPLRFGFAKRPQWHGYTEAEVVHETPFFKAGQTFRGHEFHYSFVSEIEQSDLKFALELKRGHGLNGREDGIIYNSVMASYTHVHADGTPSWTEGMMRAARDFSKVSQDGQSRMGAAGSSWSGIGTSRT